MTHDPLDDLLDHSAPMSRADVREGDLRAMIGDARRATVPRRRRAAVLGGVLTLLLVGGAGVATASSSWIWGAGMSDPNRSYTFTSPTWGACELRVGDFAAANPLQQGDVDRIIDEWFATADVATEAAPLVKKYLAQLESDQAKQADFVDDPRQPDLNYWMASDQALGELIFFELKEHGYDGELGTGVSGSASQVHCEGEQW